MVFVEIPSSLTEEEKILQSKYLKLKKKKKALQQLKAPKPEQPPLNSVQRQLKREHPKQDAKEVAKKLIKSGAISVAKPVDKNSSQGFKRSKALGRKRLGADKPAGFKPFQSESEKEKEYNPFDVDSTPAGGDQYKNMYAPESDFDKDGDPWQWKREREQKSFVNREPQTNRGNTVYVHGQGMSEGMLRSGFSPYGNILKINNQPDKNCAFVTFETIDQANEAIRAMSGQQVDGIILKVTLARRQPQGSQPAQPPSPPPPIASPSTPTSTGIGKFSWSSIASNPSQKGPSYSDSRDVISYDDL